MELQAALGAWIRSLCTPAPARTLEQPLLGYWVW